MQRWFERVVLGRRWLCFVVLGVSFAVFGLCTLNLFNLFALNARLVIEHGWMTLADGAAQQFIELLATGYAGMAGWVVFKACEYRLVHWLSEPSTHEDRDPPR